jgi:hypothetical protein
LLTLSRPFFTLPCPFCEPFLILFRFFFALFFPPTLMDLIFQPGQLAPMPHRAVITFRRRNL